MPYDNRPERNLEDFLESTSYSSISAASAAQEAAHNRVAEEVREARLAGYKSPLRRLTQRLARHRS
jgi:hypothetical protein